METWRIAWRDGFAKTLSTFHLKTLLTALEKDSSEIGQGTSTDPPAFPEFYNFAVTCADAIAYCGWKGDGLKTVQDVDEFFAKKCDEVDKLLGEPNACRYFLNWYDDTSREMVRALLIQEIKFNLDFLTLPIDFHDFFQKWTKDIPVPQEYLDDLKAAIASYSKVDQ